MILYVLDLKLSVKKCSIWRSLAHLWLKLLVRILSSSVIEYFVNSNYCVFFITVTLNFSLCSKLTNKSWWVSPVLWVDMVVVDSARVTKFHTLYFLGGFHITNQETFWLDIGNQRCILTLFTAILRRWPCHTWLYRSLFSWPLFFFLNAYSFSNKATWIPSLHFGC